MSRWKPRHPMRDARVDRKSRRGFSYLELQVSLALFAIAVSGLAPLSVVSSRQLRRLENGFDPPRTQFLVPAANPWARKLGAAAEVASQPPPSTPHEPLLVIDDGDPGYSQRNVGSNDWLQFNWSSAQGDDCRLNRHSPRGDLARWEFRDLTPGTYEVMVSYNRLGFLTRQANYRLYDGNRFLRRVIVDQRRPPSGPVLDGVRWHRLGTFSISGDRLRVELPDSPRDYIYVDAVRLTPLRNDLQIVRVRAPLGKNSASVVVSVTANVR